MSKFYFLFDKLLEKIYLSINYLNFIFLIKINDKFKIYKFIKIFWLGLV